MTKYVNVFDYYDQRFPFQFFIGGRGTGKTYSALSGCLKEKKFGSNFILMRRTANEVELLADSKGEELANPFKAINKDLKTNVGIVPVKKNLYAIYDRELNEKDKLTPKGAPLGYALALSTIASIRGVDFSDVDFIVYDEFIPEKHVRKMSGEAEALLNAYETINRNRELEGKPPVIMYCLANSNDIYIPIFTLLGVVNDIEKMISKGQTDKYYPDKGLAIHLLGDNADFVEAKSNTALYQLTKGSKFSDMALNNEFAFNDFSLVKYVNLKGYRPVCSINGKYFIYQKKGDQHLHISYMKSKCVDYNVETEQGQRAFISDIGLSLIRFFTAGLLTFESYDIKAKVLDTIL